ncbi:MAG: GAF domain-containing protein [Phycisphaerae bacterium]|nr:GAF domain-containing protein [Phycisphaerae bacterium]
MIDSNVTLGRDYAPLVGIASVSGERTARMQRVCDLLWGAFSARGLSWIGFYAKVSGAEQMVLEVRRDKPACSPIGLHGMCGRCWGERRPILVADVATLGTNYIACDPRDRSEAVVPCFDEGGSCWGVLDADSHEPGAFGLNDLAGMTALVEAFGLSVPLFPPPEPLIL